MASDVAREQTMLQVSFTNGNTNKHKGCTLAADESAGRHSASGGLQNAAIEEDAQLMLRAKHGDPESMGRLAGKYRLPLLRFFNRRVHDHSLAEDLTQDVFLRAYRYRDRYEPTAKFSTWLYSIASHVVSNWVRDHRRERYYERIDDHAPDRLPRAYMDHQPGVEERLIRRWRINRVRHAVRALPVRQRTVVVMHKFQGVACPDIAMQLECTPQAVRSLLVRAYAAMRGTLVEG
jgi:RNA polymerase sigma-70 factor (ECF subfamily)